MTIVNQILIGRVGPIGPKCISSGIDKHAATGRLFLGREGLTGDAQGDTRHHGGPDKALHHYAFEHCAHWVGAIGERKILERPGAFGENLSTQGMTEDETAIGDTFRLGGAVIQVSQGRQPCWRLNARFDVPDMATRVQKTGFTGWYYRVIEEGFIGAGDRLRLLDRACAEWTIRRTWRVLYVDTMNIDDLMAMAALAHLPDSWRGYAKRRLATRKVEDWTRRLQGDFDGSS